jgi:hypothetical protein
MIFQEYPKLMKHPAHSPAVYEQLPGKGIGLFTPDTVCRSPERFPDVTVATVDDEKKYASKGYRPANMVNAGDYEATLLEFSPVSGYINNEYPKWKYHPFELSKIVKTKAEELSLGDGWQDSPVIATEDDLDDIASLSDVKIDKRSKEYRKNLKE